ncbi:MAG: hypothetical protein ACRC28_18255 [Clostridium sp.]|uniref:hypothetical protein n=1 Tax=Clostridium sp. TaxID=1506 RepID=UPI003F30AC42
MKKFIKYSIASVLIVVLALGIYVYTSGYGIQVKEKDVKSDIFLKGFENAIQIEGDGEGNYFVCYTNEIVKINNDNQTEKIYTNTNLEIEDAIYYDKSLLVISKGDLLKINIENGGIERILKDIPYGGDRIKRKLIVKDEKILLSIGTFTNTGIAEKGDSFTKELWDKTPIDIELTGENYGEGKTGPFKKYGEQSKKDEKLKGENLGNGAIYEVKLDGTEPVIYSSGIKNILGWDINSKGEIVGAIEGLEAEGTRGVLRDTDHIYKISEGTWYGWPDYSGGDKISSPKFSKDGEKINKVIKNPLEEVVKGPYYEHKNLKGIKAFAVDKGGVLLEEDTVIFFDDIDKKVYTLDGKKIVKEFLKLDSKSSITDILMQETECLLLDGESGFIYRLTREKGNFILNVPKSIMIIVAGIGLVVLFIFVKKMMNKNNK